MATDAGIAEATKRYVPDAIAEPDLHKIREQSVPDALVRFSRDVPRVHTQEITANPQPVADLSGWDDEYSEVTEVEWPYLTKTAGIIDKQLNWFVEPNPKKGIKGVPQVTVDREDDDAFVLRFPGVPVGAGSPALLRWRRRWTTADLPAHWEDALTILASSIVARRLQGKYEGSAEPSPAGFAVVESGEKADSYRELADNLEALYMSTVGIVPPAEAAPA